MGNNDIYLRKVYSKSYLNYLFTLAITPKKFGFLVILILCPFFVLFAQFNGKTSIAMLNYLATEARIINRSKDNRLVLEDIYNKLINNSDPSVIDSATLDYFQVLLDDIQNFRMITFQRERLRFLFENQQAQAITKALPNPLYLLGTLNSNFSLVTIAGALSGNPIAEAKLAVDALKTVASVATMVMDSAFKYQNAKDNALISYLQGDWELNDKESATLHNLRSRSFVYMVNIATQYKLSRDDTLNEKSIDDFVEISLWEATPRKRQALESNRNLYSKYGPYWLVLAETYYDLGLYRECLNAIQEYENIQAPIFRKDKDFARLMPKVIVAVFNVMGNNKASIDLVTKYLQKLIENTSDSDWVLRYFAAQTYISLADDFNRARNLQTAYDLLLNNVRVLSIEQEKVLDEYYSPITSVPQSLANSLSDAEKRLTQAKIDKETVMSYKNIKVGKEQKVSLDNSIKEAERKVKDLKKIITDYSKSREKELPPFSHALWINYQLLTSLYEPLNKKENDKEYVNEIIGDAFWPLSVMENFWEVSRQGDYSWAVVILDVLSRTPGIGIFRDIRDYIKLGGKRIFLNCPDAMLTAVNSIDVKIYNANKNTILCDDKNVKWEVSTKLWRNHFKDPKIFLAGIGINLSIHPEYIKNEAYKMEIFIKNIDEQGSYNNRLYFEQPVGVTNWVFKYVEKDAR